MNKCASLAAESTLLQLFFNDPQRLRKLILAEPTFEGFLTALGPEALLDLEASPVSEPSYSGYTPQLWFVGTPSEAALGYSLWLMARRLYLASDRADLSAWLDDSLTFNYQVISKASYLKLRKKFDFVVQSESAMVAGLYPKA